VLRRAVVLGRGPALAGLHETPLAGEAARLNELRVTAIELRIGADLALGHHDRLVGELTALVGAHPTNDRLRGHLMRALYHTGRQADALAVFRAGRDFLMAELGLEPGGELVALHSAILRGELAAPAAASTRRVPAQLPAAPADFVGRDADVAALLREGPRVRVISGAGGSGKTALALHAAYLLAPSFPEGQLYAELQGMGDLPAEPEQVLLRFLRALGVEESRLPKSAQELGELYRTILADRRVLVVLDDARNEQQVRPLLPGGPHCLVLVTSRDRLTHLDGVALTELGLLEPGEALRMLSHLVGDRATGADPDSADAIIAHCGHLPLALRIAGARLASRKRLPLSWLADRLADESRRLDELSAPERGVRASIEISYRTLAPPVAEAFRRLGYLGLPGFSPWTVGWLMDTAAANAEQALETLVDAQLVEFTGLDGFGNLHYRMHDLVRLFAREQARAEDDPARLRDRVARVLRGWLAIVDRIGAASPAGELSWRYRTTSGFEVDEEIMAAVSADPKAWLEMDSEIIVAGVERAAALGMHELVCEFASASHAVAAGVNRFDIRTRINDAVTAAVRRAGDARDEAVMLAEMGKLRYEQDRYAEARQMYSEAISRFRQVGDKCGQAATLAGLGTACREPGFLREAMHFLGQAVTLLRDLGDDLGLAYALRLAGSVRLELGAYDESLSDINESLAGYQRFHSARGTALALRSLSLYHRATGDYVPAIDAASRAAQLLHSVGDELMEAYAVRALSKARLRLGEAEDVIVPLERVLSVCQNYGDRWGQGATLRTLGEAHFAAGRLDIAEEVLNAAMRLWSDLDVVLWAARTRRDLASVYEARGEHERAAESLRQAMTIFRDRGARESGEIAMGAARL
jgi:tetratricopeptide (TPR) repeat protein